MTRHNPKDPPRVKINIIDYSPLMEEGDSAKALRDRFDETIRAAFHDLLNRLKVECILDDLEQDVKDWLNDNIKGIDDGVRRTTD